MTEPTHELVSLVEQTDLTAITFRELSACVRDKPADSAEDAEPVGVKPTYALTVDINSDPARFRLRFRTELRIPQGDVAVEVAAAYGVRDFPAERLTQGLVVEYANQVGLMTLLPYVRHAIADLTARVFGEGLLMPVIPRGALTFAARDGAATDPTLEA